MTGSLTHLFILEADHLSQRRQQLLPFSMRPKQAWVPVSVEQNNVVPDVQFVWVCVLCTSDKLRIDHTVDLWMAHSPAAHPPS